MDFQKYQHLERFGTTEVEGIDIGTCHIFPKLDGTNASIWNNNDTICCGSRKRDLSKGADNAGFREWALKQENIIDFLYHNPDLRLFGEWLVPHSFKHYRDEAWRDFYVFDVMSEDGEYHHYDDYSKVLDDYKIPYIPCVKIIKNPTYEQLQKEVKANTYLIKDGFGPGEGIVVKNYNYRNKYGRITWAKIVANEFKEVHRKEMGVSEVVNRMIEEDIVERYVSPALVNKTHSKIVNEMEGWSSKYIPRLLQTTYYELVKEESWNFVKEFKQPSINFKTLQHLTIQQVKKHKPELF